MAYPQGAFLACVLGGRNMNHAAKFSVCLFALMTLSSFSTISLGGSSVIPSGFTEIFGPGETNDLDFKSVTFTPDLSDQRYTACIQPAAQFLTDPNGGTPLTLIDDQVVQVTATNGHVMLFGVAYSNFYIASNGYLTFNLTHNSFQESIATHFAFSQVSLL